MCSLKTFKLVSNGTLLSGNEELYLVKARSKGAWESNGRILLYLRHFFFGAVEIERVLVKER